MNYLLILLFVVVVILCYLVYILFNRINRLLALNDNILKHNSNVLTQVGNVIDAQHDMSINNKVISKLVNEHGNKLVHISHVISMLIEHTNCDALKNYKL